MIDYIKMYESMSASHETKSLRFPLYFNFKLLSIANDFFVKDEAGNEIAYTRQKMFKLKEWINVFPNRNQDAPVFTIHSEQIIDFGATYIIQDASGKVLGKVVHDGVGSLWRTSYQVTDAEDQLLFHIREKNPWVAVLDKMAGQIPYLGSLTGLFFQSYLFDYPTRRDFGVPLEEIEGVMGREIQPAQRSPSEFERRYLDIEFGDVVFVDGEK